MSADGMSCPRIHTDYHYLLLFLFPLLGLYSDFSACEHLCARATSLLLLFPSSNQPSTSATSQAATHHSTSSRQEMITQLIVRSRNGGGGEERVLKSFMHLLFFND